jgi:hypothetical protein
VTQKSTFSPDGSEGEGSQSNQGEDVALFPASRGELAVFGVFAHAESFKNRAAVG